MVSENAEVHLKKYYNLRANEYERVYLKPERQEDIIKLTNELQYRLKNRKILEVACGTGYWTTKIANTAKSITASDQSSETLEITNAKFFKKNNVNFIKVDAYSLAKIDGSFDCGFAGFWWSHIPKSRIESFLKLFHSKLAKFSNVIFIDNQYVEGSNHPITETDSEGTTYQIYTRMI